MKWHLARVGARLKAPLLQLYQEYEKRLTLALNCHLIANAPEGNPLQEGRLILSKIPKGAILVALDETGVSLTSQQITSFIEAQKMKNTKELCFVIGGAEGLSIEVLDRAQHRWAFGKQTWPHDWVSVMLIEQLYRAQQIAAGHPYHRG